MDALHYTEVIVYELLGFVPYLLLFLYPFRKTLRFSPVLTAIGTALLVLGRIGYTLWTHISGSTGFVPFPLFLCILLSIVAVKAHFGKSIFTMLMLTNTANFLTTAAKCIEGLFFPAEALELHRWTNSLCLLAVEILVLIPLCFYIKHIFSPAIHAPSTAASTTAWRYLWCIPLTFYAVWFRNEYFSAEGAEVLALRPRHMLYCFLINAGAMLIYSLVAALINQHAQNQRLREREHQLSMQHAQYSNLQDRIEEARRAKHDIRQHLHVISAYVKDKKYDDLEAYLNRYRKTLPEEGTFSYCDHYAVNALLQYFAGYAKMIGAGFTASMHLPATCKIPDETLTVVLGNLLENAVEACVAEGSGSFISVRGTADESAIFFKILNTAAHPPKTDRDGQYLSTKRKGSGIGLRSVRTITEQYGGILDIRHEDGVFTVSIMLNFPEC